MRARRNPKSGYALLFVFMMAAMVGLLLYRQLPRAAFEKQRDREQLLVDRGHEYVRGVQLYVKKFNKYPSDFDALEKTNNLRFLRRRYIDPMTGKDDWRILHAGPGGVLIDSKVHPQAKKEDEGSKTDMTDLSTGTSTTASPGGGASAGNRQRPGDSLPGTLPDNGAPTLPGNMPMPPIAGTPNGPIPFGPSGAVGPPNSAANLINQILTTPRPGGLNGVQTPIPTQTVIGGGIAGVASKSEREGIKTVADKSTYDEWEFFYDYANDKTRTQPQNQQQNMGQQLQQLQQNLNQGGRGGPPPPPGGPGGRGRGRSN